MAELDLEHGQDDEPAEPAKATKGKRGRPTTTAVSQDLRKLIGEGLEELAAWVNGRDPELARSLREGAPKMADFLAHHAARRARVARALKFVFAKGGPFAALRAFGPTLRTVGDKVGAWREQRAVDGELVDEQDAGPA